LRQPKLLPGLSNASRLYNHPKVQEVVVVQPIHGAPPYIRKKL
jgi:hypothetical protein